MTSRALQRSLGLEVEREISWRGTWSPGGEYTKRIHIRNTTGRTQHVLYALPAAKQFFMSFPDPISIPPGLTHEIEVRFRPTAWEALDDVIILSVGNGSLSVRCLAALAELILDVTPSVDFGFVVCREPTSRPVSLENRGQTDAVWEFDVGAPFLFTPRSGRLAPGASARINVTVVPQEACFLRATAVCRVQGGEQRIPVGLTAMAKHAHFVFAGTSGGVGDALVDVLDGGRLRINFGDVPLGVQAPPRVVTIKNAGAVDATLDVSVSGAAVAAASSDVATTRLSISPPSTRVAAGASADFTISLAAQTAGMAVSERFRFSAPGGNSIFLVALARVVGPRVKVFRRDRAGNLVSGSTGIDGPTRPLVVQFGDTPVGGRSTQVIVVTNESSRTPALWDMDAEDSGVFAFSDMRGELAPGASTQVAVTFLAPTAGNFFRRLTLLVAHGEPSHIDVIGTAFSDKHRPAPLRARHVEAFRLRDLPLRMQSPDAAGQLLRARGPPSLRERLAEAEWALSGFRTRSGDMSRAAAAIFRELFLGVEDASRPVLLLERTVDFGGARRGGAVERRSVHVLNRTSGRMAVTWVLPPALTPVGEASGQRDFVVTPESAEVEPGCALEFAVSFTPTLDAFYYSTELECFAAPKQNRSFRLVEDESFTPPVCLPLRVIGHTFPPGQSFVPRVVTCFGGSSLSQALALPPCIVGDEVFYTFQLANSGQVPAQFVFAFLGSEAGGSGAPGGGGETASSGGVFCVVPPCGLVNPREFQLISVRFRPRAPRAYVAMLTLALNNDAGGGSISIALSGEGSLPRLELPDGGSTFIKPTSLGLSSSRVLTVRNASRIPLRFSFRVPPTRASELSITPAYGDVLPGACAL